MLLCTLAVALSLASYSPGDPSLNNATGRDVANWLGPLGATAADVLLQAFGIAAIAFVAPLAVWGARALMGKGLSHAVWRAVAWPIGTVLVAAGLGWLPRLEALPAGAGGWIGIAASQLSTHAAQVYGQNWIGIALPILLLVTGLPLAFLATGLRFSRVARGVGTGAAALYWLGSKIKLPSPSSRRIVRSYDEEDEEPDANTTKSARTNTDSTSRPSRSPATRLAERRETRIKREEARRAGKPAKGAKQPALNLASGEYQLPSLGLLAEPSACARDARPSPTKRWKKMRACSKRCSPISACKGRIVAVRPGPGRDALRIRAGGGRQILARDLALRRRGALDERGGRAHRDHPRPQRHRHRTAEPDAARRSTCARCSTAPNTKRRARR